MSIVKIVDNDVDEITVTIDGKEARGWSYTNQLEHDLKMFRAREFCEGYYYTTTEPRITNNVPESQADVAAEIERALRHNFDDVRIVVELVTTTYIRVRITTGDTKQPFTYYHIRVSHSGA
jgi:hypothetical protein